MKYYLMIIGLFTLIFLGAFIGSFIYIFSIVNLFIKFNLISISNGFLISAICSLFVSIIILFYQIIRFNSQKKTKFSNWIAMNYPKLLLYYIISIICLGSLKSEIICTMEELRDLISLEWTIFGVIITIFLVWNVIIVEYLKKKKPVSEVKISPIQRKKYLEKKGEFFTNASISFNSITLITINILMLILSTGFAYISSGKINLFNQNFAIVAFYFTTNTLLEFFLDILQPLKDSKKELLDGTKVSQEEVVELNQIEEKTRRLLRTLDEISTSTAFTEDEKDKIKNKLICDYCGIEYVEAPILQNVDTKEIKEDNHEDKNDQL